MASRIPEHIIDEINSRVRLVDIVGETVQLKRQGNRYLGLCPFHQEKTPSFTVDPDRQLFYCFGCQAGGNLFGYVQKRDNLDFIEAVRQLAEQAGIPLPDGEGGLDRERLQKRQQLYDLMEAAKDYFCYQLKNHPEAKSARQYLIKRQISEETIADFSIGYAPGGWRGLSDHLLNGGFSQDQILEAGLAIRQQDGSGIFDMFRERIIFPILDYRKRCIAFGGRILYDEQPKYLNSPQTLLFDKSRGFYGIEKISRTNQQPFIIIFEGYFDLISAYQGGLHNGLAGLGTSMSLEQCRLLKRLTNRVVLCYDADQAGERATQRGLQLLRQVGLQVDIALIPKGQDPDDYIRINGGSAFLKNVIEPALPMYKYFMHTLQNKHNIKTIEGKSAFVKEYAGLLSESDSPVEIDGYVQELSTLLGVTENAIYREIRQEQRIYQRGTKGKEGTSESIDEIRGSNIDYFTEGLVQAQEMLLFLALQDSGSAEILISKLDIDDFDLPYRGLLEKFWPYWESKERVDIKGIGPQMKDEEQSLLARIFVRIESRMDDKEKAFYDCLERLTLRKNRLELERLTRLFETVNEQGDLVQAMEILQQIQSLQRKLGRQR